MELIVHNLQLGSSRLVLNHASTCSDIKDLHRKPSPPIPVVPPVPASVSVPVPTFDLQVALHVAPFIKLSELTDESNDEASEPDRTEYEQQREEMVLESAMYDEL